MLGREASLPCFDSADGAVEADASLGAMTECMMAHGQQEEVEGIKFAAAGGQAALERSDRAGELSCAVLSDAQGVEIEKLTGCHIDGSLRQVDREPWQAPGWRPDHERPCFVIVSECGRFAEVSVIGPNSQGGDQIGEGLIVPIQRAQRMPAVMVSFGVVGMVPEPRGVPRDQHFGVFSRMLEVAAERSQVDIESR
jgi:hypothetical protein